MVRRLWSCGGLFGLSLRRSCRRSRSRSFRGLGILYRRGLCRWSCWSWGLRGLNWLLGVHYRCWGRSLRSLDGLNHGSGSCGCGRRGRNGNRCLDRGGRSRLLGRQVNLASHLWTRKGCGGTNDFGLLLFALGLNGLLFFALFLNERFGLVFRRLVGGELLRQQVVLGLINLGVAVAIYLLAFGGQEVNGGIQADVQLAKYFTDADGAHRRKGRDYLNNVGGVGKKAWLIRLQTPF